jgi:uncharacterized protein YcfL
VKHGTWRKPLAAASVATSLLFCSACDKVKAPPMAMQDPLPSPEYPQVVLEVGIEKALVVDYGQIAESAATASSPLTVATPVRSKTDLEMRIQYEYVWYDDRKVEIGRSGPRFQILEPRRQVQLQANALTARATGWRLEIRAAR